MKVRKQRILAQVFHKDHALDHSYIVRVHFGVVPQNVSFHQYADDPQLYCGFKTSDYQNSVKALKDCSAAVEGWFLCNGLLLNVEKFDAVVISTSQQAEQDTS